MSSFALQLIGSPVVLTASQKTCGIFRVQVCAMPLAPSISSSSLEQKSAGSPAVVLECVVKAANFLSTPGFGDGCRKISDLVLAAVGPRMIWSRKESEAATMESGLSSEPCVSKNRCIIQEAPESSA